MLRYSNTTSAPNVKRSGNMANGPRPNAQKPKIHLIRGLEESAFRRKTAENIVNPSANSDRVLLYMSRYMTSRKIERVTLIVETTVSDV